MAQADRRRSSDWNDNDDDNDESAYLSPAEAEQIEEARNVFAKIIDHTCAQGVVDDEWNLFNQNDSGDSALKKCLFSFLPRKESLQANLDTSAPRGFFPEADDDIETYSFKVFDRRNNRLTYENMPSYHKVGMRVLFRGSLQRGLVDSKPIRKFFAKETRRLGEAFDNPESRKHIPSFIKMYQIDTNELLHPELSYYQNFNEFFYRKLKPDARPISQPNNPKSIVSAADCRLIVFDHINQATEIWIKGEHFSLRHLFHDEHLAQEFEGGSIAIFRLAPVDYHRFHSPIDGTIGSDIRPIKGTFFTVNPIAIKDKLDVLTRNQRTVLTIESDIYERVAFVAIGALLVGSVNFTVKSNQRIRKGEELGKCFLSFEHYYCCLTCCSMFLFFNYR